MQGSSSRACASFRLQSTRRFRAFEKRGPRPPANRRVRAGLGGALFVSGERQGPSTLPFPPTRGFKTRAWSCRFSFSAIAPAKGTVRADRGACRRSEAFREPIGPPVKRRSAFASIPRYRVCRREGAGSFSSPVPPDPGACRALRTAARRLSTADLAFGRRTRRRPEVHRASGGAGDIAPARTFADARFRASNSEPAKRPVVSAPSVESCLFRTPPR